MKKIVDIRSYRENDRITRKNVKADSAPPSDLEIAEERKRQRRQERKARERRELQPTFILFLVVTVIVATIVGILTSPLCNIRTVDIQGASELTEEKILEEAGHPIGQNLFLFRSGQAKNNLKLNPYIKEVQISRKPFHGLLIAVDERRPVGILVDQEVFMRFSADGMLMDSSETLQATNLPIITGLSLTSIPAPGGYIEDAVFHEALQIVNACPPDLLKSIQEINIAQPNYILAYTSKGIEVRVGNSQEIEKRMQMLADVLEQIVLTNALTDPVEYIDIRYMGSPSIKLKGQDAPQSVPASDETPGEETGQSENEGESGPAPSDVQPVV